MWKLRAMKSMSFTVFSYNATVLLIQPNHHMCWKMQPNPTHGWTQPMSISDVSIIAQLHEGRLIILGRPSWSAACEVVATSVSDDSQWASARRMFAAHSIDWQRVTPTRRWTLTRHGPASVSHRLISAHHQRMRSARSYRRELVSG